MPFTTCLPTEVVRGLSIARRVEAQARGGQRPIARAATGRLMAVIAGAGWPAAAMAPVVGLTPSAVSWRIRSARRTGLPPAGVLVPRGRQSVPRRIDEKRWLRPGEAAALLGVHRTLHRWRRGRVAAARGGDRGRRGVAVLPG